MSRIRFLTPTRYLKAFFEDLQELKLDAAANLGQKPSEDESLQARFGESFSDLHGMSKFFSTLGLDPGKAKDGVTVKASHHNGIVNWSTTQDSHTLRFAADNNLQSS